MLETPGLDPIVRNTLHSGWHFATVRFVLAGLFLIAVLTSPNDFVWAGTALAWGFAVDDLDRSPERRCCASACSIGNHGHRRPAAPARAQRSFPVARAYLLLWSLPPLAWRRRWDRLTDPFTCSRRFATCRLRSNARLPRPAPRRTAAAYGHRSRSRDGPTFAVPFDEPTSALDPERINEVLDVRAALARGATTMIVAASHEIGLARKVADRIMFLDAGEIVEDAPTARLLE